MPKVIIDNKEYDLDSLPKAAKDTLQMIQLVDSELSRLQAQTAITQTARQAYGRALQEAIAAVQLPVAEGGDTIKLS